jgi:DNA-binding NarL/FixJ family response regulator
MEIRAPDGETVDAVEAVAPIQVEGRPEGALEVYRSWSPVAAQIRNDVLVHVGTIGLALLLSAAAALPLARASAQRHAIDALNQQTRLIASILGPNLRTGELTHTLPPELQRQITLSLGSSPEVLLMRIRSARGDVLWSSVSGYSHVEQTADRHLQEALSGRTAHERMEIRAPDGETVDAVEAVAPIQVEGRPEGALEAGAVGVVLKDAPLADLARALQSGERGRSYVDPGVLQAQTAAELTQRELAVLAMIADGLSHEQIGDRLGIGSETVRTHMKKACVRLGASTRTQAVAAALRQGLIA